MLIVAELQEIELQAETLGLLVGATCLRAFDQ